MAKAALLWQSALYFSQVRGTANGQTPTRTCSYDKEDLAEMETQAHRCPLVWVRTKKKNEDYVSHHQILQLIGVWLLVDSLPASQRGFQATLPSILDFFFPSRIPYSDHWLSETVVGKEISSGDVHICIELELVMAVVRRQTSCVKFFI